MLKHRLWPKHPSLVVSESLSGQEKQAWEAPGARCVAGRVGYIKFGRLLDGTEKPRYSVGIKHGLLENQPFNGNMYRHVPFKGNDQAMHVRWPEGIHFNIVIWVIAFLMWV